MLTKVCHSVNSYIYQLRFNFTGTLIFCQIIINYNFALRMIRDNCSENFLIVLDFDDTIVEGNSEESVKRILQRREIELPAELENHYDTHRDWNLYINLLYKFLHENTISRDDIVNSLSTISFVKGY